MIELPEHETEICSAETISLDEQAAMSRHLGNRLIVTWLSGRRAQVRSSSWVGSVRLTSDLHVRVIPKLAGNSLGVLTMLAITNGIPLVELPEYLRGLSDDPDEDATELLARLVVTHTEKVVARGLIRNYRAYNDDLPFVRGRMDVYRQATKHFGQFTEFACDFNEFDRDIADNHLLLGGVSAARRATSNPKMRRRAAELERRLSDVAPTLPSTRRLLNARIVYGRRNAHYRVAHTWCRSLLTLRRVDDEEVPGEPQADAFLVNMNALFERFVEWLITTTFAGADVEVQAQKRNPSLITVNGQYPRTVAPDLVLSQRGHAVAIDAKYKRYDTWEISPSDVYQLLLYAQCYTGCTEVPTSYLIFPASRRRLSPTVVELTVPTDGERRHVRVHAIGVPLAEIVEGLRTHDLGPLTRTVEDLRTLLPFRSARTELRTADSMTGEVRPHV